MKFRIIKMTALLVAFASISCACGNKGDNTLHAEVVQVIDQKRYTDFIAEEVSVESDVIYTEAKRYDGQMQQLGLDIYTPKGDKETSRPVIVWMHGGGYTKGDKASEGFLKYLATDFAKMGYVCVVPNYRLGKEASSADVDRAVEDANTAVNWIIEHADTYGMDGRRIVLAGYSAGGGIVQNLCYTNHQEDLKIENIMGVVSISGAGLSRFMTNQPAPPCLAIHGTSDTTVSFKVSEKFIDKLTKKGITNELYPLEGLNHTLLTRYDEIRNKIGEFIYTQLTGQEREITMVSEINIEYRDVLTRQSNGIKYEVKPIDCKIDGILDEWAGFEEIKMNQLKDAGDVIPSAEDYQGTAMIGWNPENPACLYIAAKVTDDVYQDNIPEDGKWYNDDCLEIVLDVSENNVAEQFMKYAVGVSGDLSVLANEKSTKAKVRQEGNTYYYEMALDLSVFPEGTLQKTDAYQILEGKNIGFSIAYNDADDKTRETQIGWTEGASNDRTILGNLTFNKK